MASLGVGVSVGSDMDCLARSGVVRRHLGCEACLGINRLTGKGSSSVYVDCHLGCEA